MTDIETKKMIELIKALKDRSSITKNELEYYRTNLKLCEENNCPEDILQTFDLKIQETIRESDAYCEIIKELLNIMSD